IVGPSLEFRAGLRVHGPSFGALLPGGGRSIQHFALAAIETQHLMSATPVLPDHAVAVYRDAAGTWQRHLVRRRHVHFGLTCLRRVGSELDPYELRILNTDS